MIQPAPSGKKTVEIRIPHMPVPQRNWPYRVSLMQSFKQIKKKNELAIYKWFFRLIKTNWKDVDFMRRPVT